MKSEDEDFYRYKRICSAILFKNSKPDLCLVKMLKKTYELYTCEYVVKELREVFERKFKNKMHCLELFLDFVMPSIRVLKTERNILDNPIFIRDINDYPILVTAIINKMDMLITGR